MKFALFTALVASASAFPSFSMLHAHSQLEAVIEGDCNTVFSKIHDTVSGFQAKNNEPAGGLYAVKVSTPTTIEVTRTTPVKHYVDDIQFLNTNQATNGGCRIVGKSQSQSLSYLDFGTNYCNMYNVIRETFGVKFGDVTVSNCKFPASDLATCDTY